MRLQMFKNGTWNKMLRVIDQSEMIGQFLYFWKVLPPSKDFLGGKIMSPVLNIDSGSCGGNASSSSNGS